MDCLSLIMDEVFLIRKKPYNVKNFNIFSTPLLRTNRRSLNSVSLTLTTYV